MLWALDLLFKTLPYRATTGISVGIDVTVVGIVPRYVQKFIIWVSKPYAEEVSPFASKQGLFGWLVAVPEAQR